MKRFARRSKRVRTSRAPQIGGAPRGPNQDDNWPMADLHIVILAAGKGTRMKSAMPKVLHQVAGKPIIGYVLDAAARLSPQTTTVVVGHAMESLRAAIMA